MDELREEIAKLLYGEKFPGDFKSQDRALKTSYLRDADQILALVEKDDYRKIEGKPPLLSDEKLKSIEAVSALQGIVLRSKKEIRLLKKQAIAQAQRYADIEFYKKEV